MACCRKPAVYWIVFPSSPNPLHHPATASTTFPSHDAKRLVVPPSVITVSCPKQRPPLVMAVAPVAHEILTDARTNVRLDSPPQRNQFSAAYAELSLFSPKILSTTYFNRFDTKLPIAGLYINPKLAIAAVESISIILFLPPLHLSFTLPQPPFH